MRPSKRFFRATYFIWAVGCMMCSVVSSFLTGTANANEPTVTRVLILTGQNSHDWQTEAAVLRKSLADTEQFDVRVCESPAGLTAETLKSFDVLVDDYSGPRLGSASEKAIEKFVRSGKGLVVVHGAVDSLGMKEKAWPALQQMSGVTLALNACDGPAQFAAVSIVKAGHPVTAGIKSSFKIADSLYRDVTVAQNGEVLASARIVEKDVPVIVANKFGKGRVFSTLLGHDAGAMQEELFITTFARGIQWAASGNVTLPPTVRMAGLPKAEAVKILVITGGHEHETGFYSLFDGYQDISWAPVSSSKTAFQSDIRKNFDVVVMYDFSTDLDDASKRNLQAFAESGKGIVVLHHALLSYQKWPWWYEEVVGGRYRLAPEGNIPTSAAKEGGEFFVTPVQHPITAGIGPFHIWDESYKRMWISPAVKPILTTDNPDSDPTIAWVSPYEKSRVVYIELGHGHTAFRHPVYRKLVHNAILWGAGRDTQR